jgi:hypothetical protein
LTRRGNLIAGSLGSTPFFTTAKISSHGTQAPCASRFTGAFPAEQATAAIKGRAQSARSLRQVPPLNNRELFHRDRHICAYCGSELTSARLTRDHIMPVSQGGQNCWMNVVTACRSCNQRKGGRTPEQASMMLLFAPYVPNKAEYLILSNRNILADQMDFLAHHLPAQSRCRTG